MKLALCLLVAGYLVVDLCMWHGPLDRWVNTRVDAAHHVVARVQGQPITEEDLDHATQEDLFRRGEDWTKLDALARGKAHQEVLLRLIDGALIRAARLAGTATPSPANAVNEELRLFIKQFPLDTDYPARLPLQQLTESSARSWFESHREQLAVPERFHAAHLFLEGHEPKKPEREPDIRELYRQIVGRAASFEELVAKASEDERTKTMGGDLGWFSRERMPQDFMKAVVAMQPGQISQPVHTWLGWHVIKLIEKKPARVPAFEEVKDEVLARLRNERRDEAVRELLLRLPR